MSLRSRSRSRSVPRHRSTRSRSRDRSRRSRSRSGSPIDRFSRRTRSSRSRSRSASEDRRHEARRHKKHSKKAKRKEEKKHKKYKHKHNPEEAQDEQDAGDLAASEQNGVTDHDQQQQEDKPSDARSFFEQLMMQEAAKEPVGTVHSRGLPAPVSATAISVADKWECSKPGCGHANSKHASACNKCGAMKRMTEWR